MQSGTFGQPLQGKTVTYVFGINCYPSAQNGQILDEAGMVDVRMFDQFLKAVDHLRVKTVLVGDSRQLQSIDAGDVFRMVSQVIQTHTLSHVMRQKTLWQQQATQRHVINTSLESTFRNESQQFCSLTRLTAREIEICQQFLKTVAKHMLHLYHAR